MLVDNMPDPAEGGWATRSDRIAVLRKHLRGKGAEAIAAAAALDYGPVDLPGPTGEANTLTLWPRGRVLCLGPDADTLLAQAVQALAAGNAVLAVAPGAPAALQPLTGKGLPIAAIDGRADPVETRSLAVDAVAFAGSPRQMRVIRQVMAENRGQDRSPHCRGNQSGRLCAGTFRLRRHNRRRQATPACWRRCDEERAARVMIPSLLAASCPLPFTLLRRP